MQAKTETVGKRHILYDGDVIANVTPDYFKADHWRDQDQISGEAFGRGTTWFIDADEGDWVLRHYRRGGLMARISEDLYIWAGLEQTRAWAEWRLLARMHQMGLPVPAPVAAQVERQGPIYRADILVARINGVESLAQCLGEAPLPPSLWQAVGVCIGRFHRAGVFHHDLNAHNILLRDEQVYLIDFDRGGFRPPERSWHLTNLKRLKRSLLKISGMLERFHFSETDWHHLLTGYDAVK